MRLNQRQHATSRRGHSILKDEFELDHDEPLSEEMQKAIAETKRRIVEAFSNGEKIQATFRRSVETQ